MKALVFTSKRAAQTYLLSQVNKAVRWDQLAQSYYQYHVGLTRIYLWRSALLMVVALSCSVGLLLGGPKILVVPAAVILVTLLVLRVDQKVSFHFRAAAEYLLSVAEFNDLEGSEGLPGAIGNFKRRCGKYGPYSAINELPASLSNS